MISRPFTPILTISMLLNCKRAPIESYYYFEFPSYVHKNTSFDQNHLTWVPELVSFWRDSFFQSTTFVIADVFDSKYIDFHQTQALHPTEYHYLLHWNVLFYFPNMSEQTKLRQIRTCFVEKVSGLCSCVISITNHRHVAELQ